MGDRGLGGQTRGNQMRRGRRLHHTVSADAAGIFGPHSDDDPQLRGPISSRSVRGLRRSYASRHTRRGRSGCQARGSERSVVGPASKLPIVRLMAVLVCVAAGSDVRPRWTLASFTSAKAMEISSKASWRASSDSFSDRLPRKAWFSSAIRCV